MRLSEVSNRDVGCKRMLSNTSGVEVIWSAYTTRRRPGIPRKGEGRGGGGEGRGRGGEGRGGEGRGGEGRGGEGRGREGRTI